MNAGFSGHTKGFINEMEATDQTLSPAQVYDDVRDEYEERAGGDNSALFGHLYKVNLKSM